MMHLSARGRHTSGRPPDGRPAVCEETKVRVATCAPNDCSDYHLPDNMPVDVGQPAIGAVVTKSQSFVVNSQEVQDGSVEVVDFHGLNTFPRPLVAFAMRGST